MGSTSALTGAGVLPSTSVNRLFNCLPLPGVGFTGGESGMETDEVKLDETSRPSEYTVVLARESVEGLLSANRCVLLGEAAAKHSRRKRSGSFWCIPL